MPKMVKVYDYDEELVMTAIDAKEAVDNDPDRYSMDGYGARVRPVPGEGPVEIPKNWKKRPHQARVALARKLGAADVTTVEEADAVILAEARKRGISN
jgi:hypothetical protein